MLLGPYWVGGSGASLRVRAGPCLADLSEVVFELRRLDTGGLVHRYQTEAAALAFVRDVVRVGGRERAACFALVEPDSEGGEHPIAEGSDLVWRASRTEPTCNSGREQGWPAVCREDRAVQGTGPPITRRTPREDSTRPTGSLWPARS